MKEVNRMVTRTVGSVVVWERGALKGGLIKYLKMEPPLGKGKGEVQYLVLYSTQG